MMSRWTVCVALVAALSLMTPAFATTTVVSDCGLCGFQTWTNGSVNQDGNPFWDQPSADGTAMNIGNFLGKTGGFASNSSSPAINPNYYGRSIADGGAAATNFYFNTNAGFSGQLIIEVAGLASSNIFGWYVRNMDGSAGAKTMIFSGPDAAGTVKAFTPSANFGFYISTGDGFTFYTESKNNDNGAPSYAGGMDIDETLHQHFAFFNVNSTTNWLGVEDRTLKSENSMGDYNDMVIKFVEQPVPEPGTYALMGAGLFALGILRRRKA